MKNSNTVKNLKKQPYKRRHMTYMKSKRLENYTL